MKTYLFISALVIALLFPLSTHADTFCVSDATGLQTALTTASDNGEDDTVQIVQGTYVGSFIYASTEVFSLTVEGGYISDCGSRVVDPANTVLDANSTGSVLVFSTPDTNANLEIDGLTLQNGIAGNEEGGGIYTRTLGDITVSNNIITDNLANSAGGGLYSYSPGSGFITIINNEITGNTSNRPVNDGGGGGGVHAHNYGNIIITSNIITENSANGGGGIFASSSTTLNNNIVTGNMASDNGGGIYIIVSSSDTFTMTNNIIVGNTATNAGGGLYSYSVSTTLFNNTITENSANLGGGVHLRLQSNTDMADFINNIIWNNTTTNLADDVFIDNDGNGDYILSPVTLQNNDFDQSTTGTYIRIPFTIDPSNLDNEDPLFVDSSNNNYHLTISSPCIDTGRLESAPDDDMDGQSRPQGDGVDIGADEYNALEGALCKGLADYDNDVDGTDASTFKSHFGRSLFKNPCPPDGPAPVPKTGQTTSYATGDDGNYQSGMGLPEPRFTDHADGTVTDNLTGLMWLKDANCIETGHPEFDNDGTAFDGAVSWQHALHFVNGINDGTYYNCQAGYSDWRLPNIKELFSLIHNGYYDPALSNTLGTGHWTEGDPFTNMHSWYWSSTTAAKHNFLAWSVAMDVGHVYYIEDLDFYVWPVRGGH